MSLVSVKVTDLFRIVSTLVGPTGPDTFARLEGVLGANKGVGSLNLLSVVGAITAAEVAVLTLSGNLLSAVAAVPTGSSALLTFRGNGVCGAVRTRKRSMLGLLERGRVSLLRSDWSRARRTAGPSWSEGEYSSLIGRLRSGAADRIFGRTVPLRSSAGATPDEFSFETAELKVDGDKFC